MGSKALSRRQFIGASAQAALLGTLAATLKPLTAFAVDEGAITTLFDPRFPGARARALELAGAGRLCPTGGDPTGLVLQALQGRPASARRLQGVTTESVPFCLRQLAPQAHLRQRRIDRDLFEWSFEARS